MGVKRLAEFIRSVIPADVFQLLFLGGLSCLLAAHGLRWWPEGLGFGSETRSDELGGLLYAAGFLFTDLFIFSAIAAYYVCFWPGKHPMRRVFWLVCVPAFFGLILMFGRIVYLSAPAPSVLESTDSVLGHRLRWAEAILWKLPEGFHFSVIGFILITIFVARMAFGTSTLPLALPGQSNLPADNSGKWRRMRILIFLLVGPLFLANIFATFLGTEVVLVFSSRVPTNWLAGLFLTLGSVVSFGVLLCFMGREERQQTLSSVRRFGANYFLLAVAFPVGIGTMIPFVEYLPARVEWAAHDFGTYGPPQLGSYFNVPEPWLLLLFFAALFEELIFRGLVQPRFIQRYGLYRGIFLVGIVWAAFHFFYDFSFSRATDLQVLERLGIRIFTCLALSFVFGWFTLRSGSILPATVAHTLYNVSLYSSPQPSSAASTTIRNALWAALAYLLFRYWPAKTEDSAEPVPELPSEGVV